MFSPIHVLTLLLCALLFTFNGNASAEIFHFIDHEEKTPKIEIDLSAYAAPETGDIVITLRMSSANVPASHSPHAKVIQTAIEPYETYLQTPSGIRAPLINTQQNNISYENKPSVEYLLKFRPINSMYLYQLTQLNGDFEKSYTLLLKLTTIENNIELPVIFSDNIYNTYLAKHAKEKSLKLHLPSVDTETFTKDQTAHLESKLAKIFPEAPFVRAAQDQHLINGLAFRWRMHEERNTTIVSLQLVNHNKKDIILDLDRIQLGLNDTFLAPQNDLTSLPEHLKKNIIQNTSNRQYKVRAGKRFSWQFMYNTPLHSPSPLLNIDGIQVANIPIYVYPIHFKIADIRYY